MKYLQLVKPTTDDIDAQVAKVLRGLGNPEPPLDLRLVRELLQLDRCFYSSTDDSVLRETISRLKVAGLQVLRRPTLLSEAIRKFSLKALYLPDQKRILIDDTLPLLKHRWNEAHEMGHDIVPWHAGMMLGDTEHTLTPACQEIMEREANYAAGSLLFLADRFAMEASSSVPSIDNIRKLSKRFGNTITSTLWRYIDQAHIETPMVALVTGHPNVLRRKADFDAATPCRHCVQSETFAALFGSISESRLFNVIATYCGSQKGGSLGEAEIMLMDRNGEAHVFFFETFYNGHDALTLGVWKRRRGVVSSPSYGFPISRR